MTKPGTEVATVAPMEVAPVREAPELSVGALVEMLVKNNASVEIVERVVALKERMEDREAARQFNEALANFQADCPTILKDRTGKMVSGAGQGYEYQYADLATLTKTIRPHLKRNGLSYSWNTKAEGGNIEVVCTVRHIAGHKESSSCVLPTETRAGMSSQQKVGAARKYGERLSLIQALGITTADTDTDAAEEHQRITPQQADDLLALADEVGINKPKFLKWLKAGDFSEILASQYANAVRTLEDKRGAK